MDVKEIKKEIKEEETFLLKLFQLEKFVNKYKYYIIAIVVLIVVSVIGIQVNNYIKTQKLIKTNIAYNELLKNPNDKKALQILKENPKLFNLYLLHTANNDIKKLQQVAKENGIVGNIAKYQIAVLKGDKNSIQQYSMTIDSIYKDLALLNLIKLEVQNNEHQKAQQLVIQIKDPDILKFAQGLLHYGIVK